MSGTRGDKLEEHLGKSAVSPSLLWLLVPKLRFRPGFSSILMTQQNRGRVAMKTSLPSSVTSVHQLAGSSSQKRDDPHGFLDVSEDSSWTPAASEDLCL